MKKRKNRLFRNFFIFEYFDLKILLDTHKTMLFNIKMVLQASI